MKCPQCNADCWRDEVDIGVGTQYGRWHCSECAWYEGHEADAAIDADRNHVTVASMPSGDPATVDEAKAFHDGFLAGATAYAAKIGHSTLKSDNTQLAEVFADQGWKTIELFERIIGRKV